jgi:hypothetical protein
MKMKTFKRFRTIPLWFGYKFNVWCANMNRWVGNDDMPFLKFLRDEEVDEQIAQLTKNYHERMRNERR